MQTEILVDELDEILESSVQDMEDLSINGNNKVNISDVINELKKSREILSHIRVKIKKRDIMSV